MSEPEQTIPFDMETGRWTVAEVWAYREAMQKCGAAVSQPAVAAGRWEAIVDRMAAEGIAEEEQAESEGREAERPDDFPPYFYEEPIDTLLGFAWIAARRKDPEHSFTDLAERLTQGDLYDAFWSTVKEAMEAAIAAAQEGEQQANPTPEAPAGASTSPTRPSSSASARSTAGRSKASRK